MHAPLKLLIALIAGFALGLSLHPYADAAWLQVLSTQVLAPIGQVFLRLIFMIVVPMVFSALVLGVYELGQSRGLGRIAGRTLLYTAIASSLSVLIGVGLVNTLQPGSGFRIDASLVSDQAKGVQTIQQNAQSAKGFAQALVEIIPRNPLDSAVRALEGEMISLMFFALMFGVALALTSREEDKGPNVLLRCLEQIFAATMKIVEFAMRLAPYAVFAIVFNTAFKFGSGVFASLLFYVGVVVLGLLLQQFVVYTLLLRFGARRSPWEFFRRCREVYLYAFATASSNATLPLSIEAAERHLAIPSRVARFVLTVGSTANQNGTALFEGITVLFLAQVYGIQLDLMQQLQVVLMSILAGIGTAGVPGGSLPLIMILLQQVGIPAEGMALILGVDRFLDMCRTTLNVSGDLVIAAVVGRGDTATETVS